MNNVRKFISPEIKRQVFYSLPYRMISRMRLYNRQVRLACEITTRCNAACFMCTRSSLIKNNQLRAADMDSSLIKLVLEEIKKLNDSGIPVIFMPMGLGEPLLFDGIFDLFGKIKEISNKIKIVLVTNGMLLDREICEKLISLEIDEVSVSLNADNSSDYLKCVGIDAFDKTQSNITNLLTLRNERGVCLPDVFIQYIDNSPEKTGINKSINRWNRILRRNDKCYIHPVVNQAGFVNIAPLSPSRKQYPCTQPLSVSAIKINGDIYPCCSCFYSGEKKIDSLYLGNLAKQSLAGLTGTKNSAQHRIIENMRRNDYGLLPECKRCSTYRLSANCYFGLPWSMTINSRRWL